MGGGPPEGPGGVHIKKVMAYALHTRIVEHGRDLCAAAKEQSASMSASRPDNMEHAQDMGHARWPRGSS